MQVENKVISFYKFVALEDLQAIQKDLKALCTRLSIKGTILLAHEGINSTVSGAPEAIDSFKTQLCLFEFFKDLEFKECFYDKESFRRMLVKVKKYIITMRREVDPTKDTGEYLEARTFKKWQDEGKEMLILDTRNDYEVRMGTFQGAIDPKIKSFDEFPKWIDSELSDAKDKAIVTFCTGGIRCEKATAYMKQSGFKKIYQLKGGIIEYLQKTLDEPNHWEGECVVFDKRKAIGKDLSASKKSICFVCLIELNEENTHPEALPAGFACKECAQSIVSHREKRTLSGQKRHDENLRQRAEFLASQRELYAKTAPHAQQTASK